MGAVMRRYWHPIVPSAQLDEENPTEEIRLLGEDLLLYRDLKGRSILNPSPVRSCNNCPSSASPVPHQGLTQPGDP